MPHLARRRVPGLRREEVAELMGVSDDWYRWFESGRSITVSPKFLARLSEVLDLNAEDQVTLYQLALSELYRAGATATLELPDSMPSNVAPVRLPWEIDEAQRGFDAAREAFLLAQTNDLNAIRPRIVGSWERSRSSQVDATLLEAPLAFETDDAVATAREANSELLKAAAPIVAYLQTTLDDLGFCIAIADRQGGILQLGGNRDALALVERAGIVPGGNLSENAVGTNGVGTVISDARPLQLTASEHFVQGGQPLTCTGAPIRNPMSGEIDGVLVVMGDYRLVRPRLLPSVVRCALEIEEELAKVPI